MSSNNAMTASQILAQQILAQQNSMQQQQSLHKQANYPGGLGAQNAALTPETIAEYAARLKRQAFARAEVIEYFEAQLRMSLWKDDLPQRLIFEAAMRAAINKAAARKENDE